MERGVRLYKFIDRWKM